MAAYAQGTTVTLLVSFEDGDGNFADAATLLIAIGRVADNAVIVAATSTGVTHVSEGHYSYAWAVSGSQTVGDYLVEWTGTNGDGDPIGTEVVVTVVASADLGVTVAQVVAYIGSDAAARWTTDSGATYPQIQDALEAEAEAQAGRVDYPTDGTGLALNEALKRRVQRNLAMRSLPLSISVGDSETAIRVGGTDPEIRRLEAPYRARRLG